MLDLKSEDAWDLLSDEVGDIVTVIEEGYPLHKVSAIFNTNTNPVSKYASVLDNNNLTATKGAIICNNTGRLPVARSALIFDNPNLTAAKAASICDNDNLTVAKAVSILSNSNLSTNKTQSIMRSLTYSKLLDIIVDGAPNLTVTADTTISGTNRYKHLKVDSGVTLTLDDQPNILFVGKLTNDGTINKTFTGGSGGQPNITGAGAGGTGGGGIICMCKTVLNNSTIQAIGENGEDGSTVNNNASGNDGEGGAFSRIGTDDAGTGGDGNGEYNPGTGSVNAGGGGGSGSSNLGGGDGGSATYTDYATADDLYEKDKKMMIDWWLQNIADKTPTTVESTPDIKGSGGGSGGATIGDCASGGGGAGGGEIHLCVDTIDNTNGTILADAGAGGDGGSEGGNDGSGGGGGGGIIYMFYVTSLVSAGSLSVAGGAGGTGDYNADAGTAGTTKTYAV